MRNKKVLFAVQAAMIAALYVVLTYITNLLGLASGTIQVRFSEALCILPRCTWHLLPQKKEVCIHASTCHRQHYYRATRAQIRIWFYNYIQGC